MVKLIPVFVAGIVVAGFGYALWLRKNSPSRFETIGQLRDEELVEAFPGE
ncbi:MAG: putative Amino acid permease [Arthrobacter sp.]|nr:putative Amino acid permease [Arthrobacter sp.]